MKWEFALEGGDGSRGKDGVVVLETRRLDYGCGGCVAGMVCLLNLSLALSIGVTLLLLFRSVVLRVEVEMLL